jgi:Ca2+-binding RTX toxin-like protein
MTMNLIFGTLNNDVLNGTRQDDLIMGRAGRDWLKGNDGNDLLDGGDGNDSLDGGRGDDTVLGGRDNDLLDGGSGSDNLIGGSGNDTVLGGRDSDTLDGSSGNDNLRGGDGDDALLGGRDRDLLDGGRGRDSLLGGDGDDSLIGGIGSDTLDGGNGNDILFGDGAARLFGLSDRNSLVSFDPDRPDQATTIQVTGLKGNLVGVDFRPANGQLFGVTDANQVYTINPTSGVATLVSNNPTPFTLNGNSFGVDFNPTPDRLRVVSDADQNLRLNPNTGGLALNPNGTVAIDGTLAYGAGDRNAGRNPNIVAAAYTNSVAPSPDPARRTTLYEIDSNTDTLVTQGSINFLMGDPNTPVSPNTGQLFTVGSLGVDFQDAGFDIFSLNSGNPNNSVNIAYAVSDSSLYSLDLSTGSATNLGTVGNGSFNLIGLGTIGAMESARDAGDILTGASGNDTLIGGVGNDTLTGGAGMDSFSFTSPTNGVDTITDFSVANDTVFVSATSFGGGLVANTAISADQFVLGSSAMDATDRFIYNSMNGMLSFDVDGTGGVRQMQLASLSPGLSLTANDIFVVA